MSGFDITLRSQQFTEGLRMQGAEATANAAVGTSSAIRDAMRFQQAMELRKVDQAIRVQSWEMERQIQQRKLQEMMAVDLGEQSRLQTELLRNQVGLTDAQRRGAEYQLEQQKQYDQSVSPEQHALTSVLSRLSPEQMVHGRIGVRGGKLRSLTDEEYQEDFAALKSLDERRLASTAGRDLGAITNSIRAELSSAEAELSRLSVQDKTPENLGRQEELRGQIKRLLGELRQARSMMMSGSLGAGESQPLSEEEFNKSLGNTFKRLQSDRLTTTFMELLDKQAGGK